MRRPGAPAWVPALSRQGDDLAPYRAAKINWRQAEGESITVAVIPASYFDNLISLQPQFEALTGIKLRFEKVPPGQIRQKALLDLSSKTATYATHAADPMYYPLYVANKWVEPLDKYLNDATLTDAAWFKYDDIIKAWRDADSIDGKPYGIPYDGEVTVQVYRKDLYDAKGLKPADTYDQLRRQRQGADRPGNRIYGLALRGFSGAGQNMYIYPSLFRGFGGNWCSGKDIVVNSPEAVKALQVVCRHADAICAAGGAQLELARHRRCVLARHGRDLHRRAFVGRGDHESREVEGRRQDRLRALAQGPERQARDVDLELGLPDQRGADREAEEGDVALHPVGHVGRDAGAHLVEVRGPGQALGHQPRSRVEVARVRRGDEGAGDNFIPPRSNRWSRTPTSNGVRACRSGPPSARRWPRRSSRRWSARRSRRKRSTRRRRASSRS